MILKISRITGNFPDFGNRGNYDLFSTVREGDCDVWQWSATLEYSHNFLSGRIAMAVIVGDQVS